MFCAREQVKRPCSLRIIAVLGKTLEITRQRCRITGDIDHLRRLHACDGLHCLFIQSLARRVDGQHVRTLSPLGQHHGCLTGIGTDEGHVFHAIARGILLRILDGLGNDLDADDLARLGSQRQRNRTRTAVQVDDCLTTVQVCLLYTSDAADD